MDEASLISFINTNAFVFSPKGLSLFKYSTVKSGAVVSLTMVYTASRFVSSVILLSLPALSFTTIFTVLEPSDNFPKMSLIIIV